MTVCIISGQPWRIQDRVPSKSNTTCVALGRGVNEGSSSMSSWGGAVGTATVKAGCGKKQVCTVNSLIRGRDCFPMGTCNWMPCNAVIFSPPLPLRRPHHLALLGPSAPERLRLGVDNFAVRAMGWNANQLIDYAKELRCDSLFITDLGPFESFQDKYLKNVKAYADDQASSSTSGRGVFARPRRPSRILGVRPRNIWRWAFAFPRRWDHRRSG